MKTIQKIRAVALAFLVAGLSACVHYPTEKRSVVDQRPQIAFRMNDVEGRTGAARVLVDGLDVGSAREFAEGRAALRVLPGTHIIQVVLDERVLLMERTYLSDGVIRSFDIK